MSLELFDYVSMISVPIICYAIHLQVGWIGGLTAFSVFSILFIIIKIHDNPVDEKLALGEIRMNRKKRGDGDE